MILTKAKISCYKIKKIIERFCIDIDAAKTSKILKINRNTANKYFNIFRNKICQNQRNEFQKFVGKLELDESYFGEKRVSGLHRKLKRGGGTLKQPVFGIYERNGKVYTKIMPDCKKKTPQAIILGGISTESIIHTGLPERLLRIG